MFQIWDSVDSRHNSLTRIGLYKALALIALAQQGKAVNTKLLDTYSDQGLLATNMYSCCFLLISGLILHHWFFKNYYSVNHFC